MEKSDQVLRELTPEAIAAAKALLRAAEHGALATLEPGSGQPLATRVGLATFPDGTPLIIASALAAHYAALIADPRCSLLVGEAGTGDALALPRLSLICRATMLARDGAAADEAKAGYLATHRKAQIYVELPDFRFFRLEIERVSFNGGFGRAYVLSRLDLLD
jgi:putative heme iron utilization protein